MELSRRRAKSFKELASHAALPARRLVEHDAYEIWNTTLALIGDAVRKAGIGADDLAAIGITNQRETGIMWGRATGEPVHPAIVWQDRRPVRYRDELRVLGHRGFDRRQDRPTDRPLFSATKVKWLLENVTGLRQRAERGEVAFGTIDSWLVWNLTGGRKHITDRSNAARTLLYDIHQLRWDDELLGLWTFRRCAASLFRGHTVGSGGTGIGAQVVMTIPRRSGNGG